jgi:LPS export ABC transporter protein LptC
MRSIRELRFTAMAMFALLLLGAAGCENDLKEVRNFTQGKKLPLQTGQDIEVQYNDSGKVKIKLKAPQVDEYGGNAPYTEMPKGVNVQFFDDSLKVNTSLRANYAIRKERERFMEAKYNVVVVNVKNEKLETEHLVWDGAKRRIYTKSKVTITTADQITIGTGLESDELFTDYTIENVESIITLKEGEETPK